MSRFLAYLAFVFILVAGIFVRFDQLSLKPLHADEAVQATQLSTLMDEGVYAFNPRHAHGPTLYYLSDFLLKSIGVESGAGLDETNLRYFPALCGCLLLLVALCYRRLLTPGGLLFAGLCLAFSPALVYYSRYFIQEMFFTLTVTVFVISFGELFTNGRTVNEYPKWLFLVMGCALGLAHATKETVLVSGLAVFPALLLSFGPGKTATAFSQLFKGILRLPILIFPIAAILCSTAFYSSFGTNFQGILDSFTTFFSYEVMPGHEKPWYYFFQLWGIGELRGGFYWGESILFLGGSMGLILAHFPSAAEYGKDLRPLRFIGIYGWICLIIYSCVAYKTPWLIVSIIPSFCILSGYAFGRLTGNTRNIQTQAGMILASVLILVIGIMLSQPISLGALLFGQSQETKRLVSGMLPSKFVLTAIACIPVFYGLLSILIQQIRRRYFRIHWRTMQVLAGSFLFLFCLYTLGTQVFLGNYVFHSDPRNPYAYSATAEDIHRLVRDMNAFRQAHQEPTVYVYANNSWPLPWYIRDFPQAAYWKDQTFRPDADIYIFVSDRAFPFKPDEEKYTVQFYGLRSEIPAAVYYRK